VTSGLLAALDDAELEAVLGHELTHIRNGDVRMLVIAVIIAGAIGFFAEMFFRLWFYNGFRGRRSSDGESDRGRGGNFIAIVIAIVLVAIAWLLSSVIRFALSRSREFLADAGSVELTKNPDAMILALRKIEGRGELQGATSAVMEMCVDNPREEFTDLFSTHPSIEARIKALVEVMGGHDPGPLALPGPEEEMQTDGYAQGQLGPNDTQAGPWGKAANEPQPNTQPSAPWGQPAPEPASPRPFLPDRPPIDLGGPPAAPQNRDGPTGRGDKPSR
jgi:heat shock protein HtpX